MTDSIINIAITREEIEKEDIPHQDSNNNNKNSSGGHLKKRLNVITLPTIVTIPLYSTETANSIKKIEAGFYDYYVFLSARSVGFFFDLVNMEKNANSILENIRKKNKTSNNFIAIGPKTKKAIEKHGLNASLATTPHNKGEFSLNSIIEFLDKLDTGNGKEKVKILMPRSLESQKSNNIITKKYNSLCLDQVFFYGTMEFNKIGKSGQWSKFKSLVCRKEINSILFTSPSSVRAFFKIMADSSVTNIHPNDQLPTPQPSDVKDEQKLMGLLGIKSIVSLGPKTSEELKKRNIAFLESKEHTVRGALEYMLERL
ncbi:MAG: uroporphyrinogen-III synthase [Nitrosopumilus sp.]|nr:uroporphyrinogen-III synthase [Nitrosopumilus sp.]